MTVTLVTVTVVTVTVMTVMTVVTVVTVLEVIKRLGGWDHLELRAPHHQVVETHRD